MRFLILEDHGEPARLLGRDDDAARCFLDVEATGAQTRAHCSEITRAEGRRCGCRPGVRRAARSDRRPGVWPRGRAPRRATETGSSVLKQTICPPSWCLR